MHDEENKAAENATSPRYVTGTGNPNAHLEYRFFAGTAEPFPRRFRGLRSAETGVVAVGVVLTAAQFVRQGAGFFPRPLATIRWAVFGGVRLER